MLKKIFYCVLIGIVLGLIALLVINYLNYDKLRKENNNLKQETIVIKNVQTTLEEYLIEATDNYNKLQEEKKNLIEEYELWKVRNQTIKDYL